MVLKKPIWAAAALALISTNSAAETTTGPTDSQILAIYAQVNSFDIETAFLAISKDCSATTTELAHHLAHDHLAVRRSVLDLAVEADIEYELPKERVVAQIEHDATMMHLASLGCDEFDEAFLTHDVAFHEAAIAAVRTALLPSAKAPELKEHFEDILPAFELHLEMAKAVQAGGAVSDVHPSAEGDH